jgi:type II secretory pathway pseudopilin PulG
MSRIRKRLAAERGSILVEVLVGTILLALTTAAVLDGLDGAQKTGRKNKDRSASATLAQQDIERMRSIPPAILAGMHQTRTVTVANVPYTVVSQADWVSDANGHVSCVSSNSQAEYMKLTATVNSPASADAPVSASSLLTPSGAFGDDTGTAAVKLTDRDGEPLSGVAVTLSGPGSGSETTNDLGCAIFAYIEPGNWTASVSGGLVNWNGGSPSTSAVTVAIGKTSSTQMELDVPASLRASFVTPAGTATTYKALSVANSKLTSGIKAVTWTTPSATRDIDKLFPFYDGYGVYAGSCKANNPALWDSDYFETAGFGFAALDPGEALQPVQVVVPQIAVTVRRMNGVTPQTFSQARIYVKQRDSTYQCTATIDNLTSTGSSHTSYVFTVPVPFGNYEVCAATRVSGSPANWQRKLTVTSGSPLHRNMTTTASAIANSALALDTPTTGSAGECTSTP